RLNYRLKARWPPHSLRCNPGLTSQVHAPLSTEGANWMGKVDKNKAEKVGDFLFRYMQARHRFKDRLERPLPSHELAMLIQRGKQEFDEIYIEPDANPPIVLDGKADDVFDAIIKKRYRAIPFWDPALVAAWR